MRKRLNMNIFLGLQGKVILLLFLILIKLKKQKIYVENVDVFRR
jgi:hypothetical protein